MKGKYCILFWVHKCECGCKLFLFICILRLSGDSVSWDEIQLTTGHNPNDDIGNKWMNDEFHEYQIEPPTTMKSSITSKTSSSIQNCCPCVCVADRAHTALWTERDMWETTSRTWNTDKASSTTQMDPNMKVCQHLTARAYVTVDCND